MADKESDALKVGLEILMGRAKSEAPKFIITSHDGKVLAHGNTQKEFLASRQLYLDGLPKKEVK